MTLIPSLHTLIVVLPICVKNVVRIGEMKLEKENMCKHTGGECFCILRLNVIKYSTYLC